MTFLPILDSARATLRLTRSPLSLFQLPSHPEAAISRPTRSLLQVSKFFDFNLLGYTWGKENKEISNEAIQSFSGHFYKQVPLWVSQNFMGFFMVPDSGVWNYNFIGLKIDPGSEFSYTLGCPKDFYHE